MNQEIIEENIKEIEQLVRELEQICKTADIVRRQRAMGIYDNLEDLK